MSRGTRLASWGLLAAASCMPLGCAGTLPDAGTSVIIAGSVCSGEPHLTAAPAAPPVHAATHPQLLAYVTEGRPGALVVYDLEQARERFRVAVELRYRPQILDDVVVAVDQNGQLVGYDLTTGEPRFSRPVERSSWLGAVQVGPVVISSSSSLSYRPAERGSTVVAVDARSGSERWQRSVPYALSRPVVLAERVLLASDHADLWALDAQSGDTAGCASFGREPIDWLEVLDRQLLVGGTAAQQVLLTAPPASPPVSGARLQLPFEQLPGRPSMRASSYDGVPAARSAHGRVGVAVPLQADAAGPKLAGSSYFYTFYRELFAYAPDGQLLWAHLFDHDLVAVRALGDALLAVTESGALHWLRARDGAWLAQQPLPNRLTSASLQLDRLPALGADQAARALTLRDELTAVALDTDARLLPGRKLATSALATLDDPLATRDLLSVYAQSHAPAELRSHVAKLLAARHTGGDFLLAALGTDYDFLSGQAAPPLAAIVPGLVNMRDTRAVPRLIDRLFDPDTTLAELRLVTDALAELGTPAALPALARFYAMYHADSAFTPDASALVTAARVLWKSGGAPEQKLVQATAQDPSTLAHVTSSLVPLVAAAEAPAPAATVTAQAPTPKPQQPARPRLVDSDISRTFAEHEAELRDCVAAAKDPSLHALRFSFVIERDGTLSRPRIWPERETWQQCLLPKLSETRFPPVTSGRRMASYTFILNRGAKDNEVPTKPSTDTPFWQTAKQRSLAQTITSPTHQTPWWQNQNPLYLSVDEPPAPPKPQTPTPDPQPNPQPEPWWTPTQ